MPGSARQQLRLLAAAVASPQIELQHDAKIVGHHQRLDAAAQTAERERHHRHAQLGRRADVAAPLIEAEGDLSSRSSRIGTSRILPRTEAVHRMPVACGAGCKARTRTDEGAILP